MTRLILVAAGGLLLATASAPPPATTAGAYPVCSAKIKDRCVQRHERGSYAAPRPAAAAPAGGESELSSVVAAGPPAASAAPAQAAPTAQAYAARPAATHPATAHRRAYRLAMRAGERG